VAECIFKVLGYLLWCFEKCVKFLNKNAYIQVALRGTPFCTSAKNAFFLILRNIVRFGAMAMLGACVRVIGELFVTVATTLVGYLILQALYPEVDPILPVAIYFVLGYLVSRMLMNVFGLAVDTTLQCFIITEEMKHREGDFVPKALSAFVQKQDLNGSEDRHPCCSCSCFRSSRVEAHEGRTAG